MATKRVNMTIDFGGLRRVLQLCWKESIKISTWVNLKMKEFIEEEKMIEEMRKKRSY